MRVGFETLLRAEEHKLGAALQLAMRDPELRELYLAGDRDALQDATEPVFETLEQEYGVTHWYFISRERSTILLRVHNPYKHGDAVDRSTFDVAAATGQLASGLDLGKTAFALRVVSPWMDPKGALIGYMEMGEEVDRLLDDIKHLRGDEAAIVLPKSRLKPAAWADLRRAAGRPDNWDDHDANVVWASTAEPDDLTYYEGDLSALPDDGRMLPEVDVGERRYIRGVFPLRDVRGDVVGGLVIASDATTLREGLAGSLERVAVATALLAAIFSVLVITMVELFVLRPMTRAQREGDTG